MWENEKGKIGNIKGRKEDAGIEEGRGRRRHGGEGKSWEEDGDMEIQKEEMIGPIFQHSQSLTYTIRTASVHLGI